MKKILFGFILAMVCISCSNRNSVVIPYTPDSHLDAAQEWSPHPGANEWWYVTGWLTDRNDGLYFYQFTIFHATPNLEWYALHLAFCDIKRKTSLFEEKLQMSSDLAYGNASDIVFNDNSIRLASNTMRMKANGAAIRYELTSVLAKAAAWHGRNGIISMGHPGDASQNSFYYSYTLMPTTGWVEIAGTNKLTGLTGYSWFDRQWGKFREVGWDWFSLRFEDGEEAMLFVYPKTGHREGTFVDSKGMTTAFSNYTYTVEEWKTFDGRQYGVKWKLQIPFKSTNYTVNRLMDDQYHPNRLNNYWEGLCEIRDDKGRFAGYCVMEGTQYARSDK